MNADLKFSANDEGERVDDKKARVGVFRKRGVGVRGAGCGVRTAGCGLRGQQKQKKNKKITAIIKQPIKQYKNKQKQLNTNKNTIKIQENIKIERELNI